MFDDFKHFLLKGNVVDLAVAVVVGTAFNAVVTSLVTNLINPLIAATVGKPDFSAVVFYFHGGKFTVGLFLNALIAFLLVTTAVYFVLVAPMRALNRRLHPPVPPQTKVCPECISEINIAAKRCAHCGVELTPRPAPAA